LENGRGSLSAPLTVTSPDVRTAARIRQLVDATDSLEPNSLYAYLLLCTHFAETSLVAESGADVAGFVAAYRPPTTPETVFVWQIGVAQSWRGQGLGVRLLDELCRQPACRRVRYVEATVTPSNLVSRKLFTAFARTRGADLTVTPHFTSDHFAPFDHENEELYRIGPLR